MHKEIKISNGILEVVISPIGAELTSIKKGGRELLWQKDPDVWNRQAPVLFPICGALSNDKFSYNGKFYSMQKHGFAKNAEFSEEYKDEEKAVLLLKSTEETRAFYPFDFEFRTVFSLIGSSLKIEYIVKNLTDGDMYFSVGAHEGYACPHGIEEWSINFEKYEDLYSVNVSGGLLSSEKTLIGKNVIQLPLKYDLFAVDALVFTDLKSKNLTLKNEKTAQKINVDFDGFPYLLIWTIKDAKFLCIEPWCGLPDFLGESLDLSVKRGIIHLAKGEETSRVHKLTF